MSEPHLRAERRPPALRRGRDAVQRARGRGPHGQRAASWWRSSRRPGPANRRLLHLSGLLERPQSGEIEIIGTPTTQLSRARPHAAAPHDHRLRLPVPPSAARVHRARECRDAAADRRQVARPRPTSAAANCSICSASGRAPRIGRPSCRAASSSASPSPAPPPTIRGSILADEPTGNLDPATSDLVFEALQTLIRDEGAAALIATHNHDLARRADRIVTLDGMDWSQPLTL